MTSSPTWLCTCASANLKLPQVVVCQNHVASFNFVAPRRLPRFVSWCHLDTRMRHSLRNHSPVRRGFRPDNGSTLFGNDGSNKASHESEAFGGGQARDAEKPVHRTSFHDDRRRSSWAQKGDPFGDEEEAEVKYRTLRWW